MASLLGAAVVLAACAPAPVASPGSIEAARAALRTLISDVTAATAYRYQLAAALRVERAVSAVERKPAQLVAQPLVVEHKFSDLAGELGALPLALQAASRLALVFRPLPPAPP